MRRNKTDIAEEILKVALKGANKTQIVNQAHVNFNLASKYLEMLNEKEFIRRENGYLLLPIKGSFSKKLLKN